MLSIFLENYVQARQMNESWITHKQMLAATLSTPVVLLQMSECSIFVFAVIFPVLTHQFSTASADSRILASKSMFQQQNLKTPFWTNDPLCLRRLFSWVAVTAFIMCLNTKREQVTKAHWWLDLRVALYSRIEMLKAHTYFQICQNNSGQFCKRCFAQSDMLEKIVAKLVSRILRKRWNCFHQRRFSVMLPEHLQDWK